MNFLLLCKEKLARRAADQLEADQRNTRKIQILMRAVSGIEDIGLKAIAGGSYWQLVICTPNVDWRARIEQGFFNENGWKEALNGDKYQVKLSNSKDPGYEYDCFITGSIPDLSCWVRSKLADYAVDAGLIS